MVELRLGLIRAGLAQDLVGLAQLPHLPLERLDLVLLRAGRPGPKTLVALGVAHPMVRCLARSADLGRNRQDRLIL